jgi:hypothetical protein
LTLHIIKANAVPNSLKTRQRARLKGDGISSNDEIVNVSVAA